MSVDIKQKLYSHIHTLSLKSKLHEIYTPIFHIYILSLPDLFCFFQLCYLLRSGHTKLEFYHLLYQLIP